MSVIYCTPSPSAATIHLDRGRSLVLFAGNGVIRRLQILAGYARGSFLVADKNSCATTLLPDEWPRLPSPPRRGNCRRTWPDNTSRCGFKRQVWSGRQDLGA